MSATFDRTWMWHPAFKEQESNTAGLFVHFRKTILLRDELPKTLKIHITADTRYKLYINRRLVQFGPVKGDQNLWFYDEVDIAPFLQLGENRFAVHVLRFFSATQYAPSFARLPTGGLRVVAVEADASGSWGVELNSSTSWECAIDPCATLRVDEAEDSFLHVYERHTRTDQLSFEWLQAEILAFKSSTGNAPPWNLSPRLIPNHTVTSSSFDELYMCESTLQADLWRSLLIGSHSLRDKEAELCLPSYSKHEIWLGVQYHTTAFLELVFQRPKELGSSVSITYSESFEDEPDLYAGIRRKAHRLDTSKSLIGPQDIYHMQGEKQAVVLSYHETEEIDDIFVPHHWRTFRFIKLNINVGPSVLVFKGIRIDAVHYPLDVHASFSTEPASALVEQLWATSVRTLANCMHDCYEDCPFYEQLQYAMDVRSTALFTYCVSGDGRLAKQAMLQLFYTFEGRMGLTTSRAPTNRQQFIPHFSLYWINMLKDYHSYFGDATFIKRFMPVVDAILSHFDSLIDPTLHLVKLVNEPGIWNFVDWTPEWKPYGVPPAAERSNFCTFTSEIYAYTLQNAASLLGDLDRPCIAEEYISRATRVNVAIREHCYDGEFFTDSPVSSYGNSAPTLSQHSQIWAVLCGAITGIRAQDMLRKVVAPSYKRKTFVQASVAMAFYTLRALAKAGGGVYEEHFHDFWTPWKAQLDLGVTTWVEDATAQRSDCHAWGSVPLYEFMAEVAGIRPAGPGWEGIECQPRLGLYKKVEASVPMSLSADRKLKGMVRVAWDRVDEEQGLTELSLKLEMDRSHPMTVHVRIPGKVSRFSVEGATLKITANSIDAYSDGTGTDIVVTLPAGCGACDKSRTA